MLSQAAEDELSLLENVFPEIAVEPSRDSASSAEVTLDIRPATGDDPEKQLVCVTAKFRLSNKYPEDAAFCELLRPRGLSEDDVALLAGRVNSILTVNVGQAMLYEAIEVIRDVLTNSNVPHGPCPICLEDFDSESAIAKTDCYHHLHIRCLASYINCCLQSTLDAASADVVPAAAAAGQSVASSRGHAASAAASARSEASSCGANAQEYPCPVCRRPSSMEITKSEAWAATTATPWPTYSDGVAADGIKYCPTLEELQERERRQALYEKQQRKGGIIDVEADRARLHLPPPRLRAAAAAAAEPASAAQASPDDGVLLASDSAAVDRRTAGNFPRSSSPPSDGIGSH